MDIKIIDLSFISFREILQLQIDSKSEVFVDMLLIFEHKFYPENGQYILEAVQQNSEKLRTNLDSLISKHAEELPELHRMKSFISLLPHEHFFIILKGRLSSTDAFLKYISHLENIHESHGIKVDRSVNSLNWGSLPKLYNISMFGHERKNIGTWNKNLRICRFCDGKLGETNKFNKKVTFKNKAHAFSEALGNKQVTLFEECDACNARFGSDTGIEFSLIALLKMFRAAYSFKGKGGIKEVEGENFTLYSNGELIEIKYDESIAEELDQENFKLKLILNDKFIPQNIYRCLCKFILSVIDSEHLIFFSKTIEWLNYGFNADELPKIAFLQDASFFTPQPILMFFQRKDECDNIPFMVGEFHYADMIYVFIIPFSEKDNKSFVAQDDYNLFWEQFNQVRENRNWVHMDY